jgi:hypothetical protein
MNNQEDVYKRAVTALEEHGFLFQKRCVEEIRRLGGRYRLESEEYPVTLGQEDTVIDFVLRMLDTGRTYVVFECKRANPDYLSWVFPVCDLGVEPERRFLLTSVMREIHDPQKVLIATHEAHVLGLNPLQTGDMGLEFSCNGQRGGRSSRTDAIYAACRQVMTGVGGLALERKRRMGANISETFFCIPVVITSADLYVTKYRPLDVSLKTGNVLPEKGHTQAVDWIIYDFPVPEPLQVTAPEDSPSTSIGPDEHYRRLFKVKSVVIVRSASIVAFLQQLKSPD